MRNDTLNGVLTFVLGVLVVLGVVFALRVVNVTHETRQLATAAAQANGRLMQAKAIFAEAAAYDKKYPSPELNNILMSVQPRATTPAVAPNR